MVLDRDHAWQKRQGLPAEHGNECVENQTKDEEDLGDTDPEFGFSKEPDGEQI